MLLGEACRLVGTPVEVQQDPDPKERLDKYLKEGAGESETDREEFPEWAP